MKRILILLCLPLLFATCKKEEDNTPTNNTGNNSTQTYVPDDNFEAYLEANGMGNGIANDDYVTTASINTVTTLDFWIENIADLTGIEDFTALTTLECWGLQLTTLDVSQNTALTSLDCADNQITNLNVSNNTALTDLECGGNNLTTLDVSGATALTDLNCPSNQLTSLDVSNNTALTNLNCASNQLTTLDVRNGNNTNMNHIYANNNPNLICINVDVVDWATTNWTVANGNIGPQHYFSENCP